MSVDLFAGISVTDFPAALQWYETLFGSPPAFRPNDVEAVWEIAEHRFVYVENRPAHAGHAQCTLFVEDFDARMAAIADRGLRPTHRDTYDNGVRKYIFVDADGNEIGFGGAPL